jgi:hypothetical protein
MPSRRPKPDEGTCGKSLVMYQELRGFGGYGTTQSIQHAEAPRTHSQLHMQPAIGECGYATADMVAILGAAHMVKTCLERHSIGYPLGFPNSLEHCGVISHINNILRKLSSVLFRKPPKIIHQSLEIFQAVKQHVSHSLVALR